MEGQRRVLRLRQALRPIASGAQTARSCVGGRAMAHPIVIGKEEFGPQAPVEGQHPRRRHLAFRGGREA
eukprot:434510-Pyramimonas_sp.AAC.1